MRKIKEVRIMSKFTDGLKKGIGCALGGAAVMGTIGFLVAGPPGFVAGVTKGLVGGAAAGAGSGAA